MDDTDGTQTLHSAHEESAHEESAHEESAHEESAHEESAHEESEHEESEHEDSAYEEPPPVVSEPPSPNDSAEQPRPGLEADMHTPPRDRARPWPVTWHNEACARTWWLRYRPGRRSTRRTGTCRRTDWPTSAAKHPWAEAQPAEVAPTYVYLASDTDSSYTVGEVIAVTGGIADTR